MAGRRGRRAAGAPADPARQERLSFQLLAIAYRQHPASLAVNLLVALVVAWQVGDAEPATWRWLAVVCALTAARGALYVAFKRRGARAAAVDVRSRKRWQHAHEAGLLAAAALWALLAWRALPGLPDEPRFVIVVSIGGLTAGASGMLAPLRGPAILYMSILTLPGAVRLIQSDAAFLGLLVSAFLLVMLVGHATNRVVLLRSLALQEDNAGLVASLRTQNDRVRQLNASLERRVAERTEALETMAHHDALTGLANRRGMLRTLDERLAGDAADGTALLFLDLDRFKQINDGLGHDAGDVVLQRVAERFAAAMPGDGAIGRWGGDEFVVIAAGGGDAAATAALADALAGSLVDAIDVSGEPLQLAVSIGVAVYPQDGSSATALIRAADLAATEVKRTGRGQIRFYHRTLSESQRRRLELSLGLKSAMAEGSLGVAYQPVVDAASGTVASLEALLRWRHPVLGPIAPDEFIPIAEESDRIVEVGAWVLRRACLDAMTWPDDDGLAPRVAVNVSVRQLLSPGFERVVATALEDSGLPGDRLEVEVTESVFDPRHTAVTLESLLRLRALGARIHVDDFGAGYSSLSRLHEFPIDVIKVDRSFTGNLDGAGRAIFEGAIVIARRFGLGVVAEGVETEAQARELCALGVDALQGYWLGAPDLAPRTRALAPTWLPDARLGARPGDRP